MDRKQVKRLLALLKARAEYTDRTIEIDIPPGFKQSFESQPAFRGWINYHVTWDVSDDDAWTVVARKKSLAAEWHETLIRSVPVIQPDGTIVPASDRRR
jgi:hypothetical protein